MNVTNLELIFVDNPDTKIIYMQDTSNYNPDITVSNPLLKITPPNFSTQYVIEYPKLSLISFNSNALGWTDVQDWNKLVILPDGLWKIQQSIDPNDCIYRDYNHFRIVNLKKKILCYVSEQLDSSSPNCNIDSDWYADIFFNLQLLESAKYMAECCDYTQQATILYNQVEIWFKRYGCESGC